MTKKLVPVFSVLMVLALVLAACATPTAEPVVTEAPAAAEPAAPAEEMVEALPQGQELADAYAGKLAEPL
jgi:hypothetical protein